MPRAHFWYETIYREDRENNSESERERENNSVRKKEKRERVDVYGWKKVRIPSTQSFCMRANIRPRGPIIIIWPYGGSRFDAFQIQRLTSLPSSVLLSFALLISLTPCPLAALWNVLGPISMSEQRTTATISRNSRYSDSSSSLERIENRSNILLRSIDSLWWIIMRITVIK